MLLAPPEPGASDFSRSRMAETWLSRRTRSVWLARSASRLYSTSVLSMTLLRRIHRFLNSCSACGAGRRGAGHAAGEHPGEQLGRIVLGQRGLAGLAEEHGVPVVAAHEHAGLDRPQPRRALDLVGDGLVDGLPVRSARCRPCSARRSGCRSWRACGPLPWPPVWVMVRPSKIIRFCFSGSNGLWTLLSVKFRSVPARVPGRVHHAVLGEVGEQPDRGAAALRPFAPTSAPGTAAPGRRCRPRAAGPAGRCGANARDQW